MAQTAKQATINFRISISLWLFHINVLSVFISKRFYVSNTGFYIVITTIMNRNM